MRMRHIVMGTMACALMASAGGTASAEPVKMRIQWAAVPGHITPLITEAPKEIYRHYGKSYVVVPLRMRGSGPALTALAAGEIEMGGMSVQALTLGVKRAKIDLTVVGQQMSNGVPGWGDSEYWVRKEVIQKLEDVKGKRVGINARGSTIDAGAQSMMATVGLRPGRDYQPVEVSIPAQLAALESGRVDVAFLVQPFNMLAARKGKYKRLFKMSDALGPSETITWIARADWVKKNRAAIVDFLEDNIRLRRWIANNRDKAVGLIAKVSKRPAKLYQSWVFTKEDNYREPNAKPNVARMQKNIDDLVKLKILPFGLDVKKYVDLSLSAEAAARVK